MVVGGHDVKKRDSLGNNLLVEGDQDDHARSHGNAHLDYIYRRDTGLNNKHKWLLMSQWK